MKRYAARRSDVPPCCAWEVLDGVDLGRVVRESLTENQAVLLAEELNWRWEAFSALMFGEGA